MKKWMVNRSIVAALILLGTFGTLQNASAEDCPDSANLQVVPFTFGLDTNYQSNSPMFQGFTSNYFTNYGTVISKRDFKPFYFAEEPDASHVALAYLSSGNNQELSKVNRDISTGDLEELWNKGGYLKNFSRGSYPYLLSQRGTDVVIKSALQFSNDGSTWTDSTSPNDPFWIQKLGFGNESFVRYSFQINLKGCQNPYNLNTNSIKLLGINTTPLSASNLFLHINTLTNKNPEDAGYFKKDTLSFQFKDFLSQERFFATYPNWIDSSLKALASFDWSSGYYNQRAISGEWYNLGSNSQNMSVVGMQPTGCLQNSPTDFGVVKLLKDCQLGIYVQSAYQNWEKYARYLLVGTVNVKLKSTPIAPSPTPKASTIGAVKKQLNWTCIKGKKSLKFTGIVAVCPSGYKLKK